MESPINIKLKEPWTLINLAFFSIASETKFIGSSFFESFTAVFIFLSNSCILSPFLTDISRLSNDLFFSKYSFISKLDTCLVLPKSNLFWTKIALRYGYLAILILLISFFIKLKLSVLVISTKNKAHWHSYKKLSIKSSSFTNSSSILISYTFKFNDIFWSTSTDILVVENAIY